MRVQFSSREILLATSLVALAFVGFYWFRKLTGINPASEAVWVAGENVDATWHDKPWRHTSGLCLSSNQITSGNWLGQASIKVHQALFTIAYKNYFGQEVYRANVYLDGHRTDDWSCYWIRTMSTGGGIVDGGTTVLCKHSQGTSSIKLVITQYLNYRQRAKQLELVFDRVGDSFVPRTDTAKSR